MKRKEVLRQLSKLAESLPMVYDSIVTPVEITGEDIHLSGLDSEGVENSDKVYCISMPFFFPVNHSRRMRSAYDSGGFEAVKKYIKSLK